MALRGIGDTGFPARFQSRCSECGESIEVDDRIVYVIDGGYRHAVCPEIMPEKPTKFQGTTLEDMGF